MSFSHPFFCLPCGRIDIGFHLHTFFLPFSLPAFDVNGQTSLIVEWCLIKQLKSTITSVRQSQWPCGIRRRPAEIVGSNPTGGMDVCLL